MRRFHPSLYKATVKLRGKPQLRDCLKDRFKDHPIWHNKRIPPFLRLSTIRSHRFLDAPTPCRDPVHSVEILPPWIALRRKSSIRWRTRSFSPPSRWVI